MDPTKHPEGSRGTLGGVLGKLSRAVVSERDWVWVVRAVAAGDEHALHALYERTHRLVFTLIMRITSNREAAEELTLEVYLDAWRQAAHYNVEDGTVLGWVMDLARSRALDRLPSAEEKLLQAEERGRMQTALATLTAAERETLEAAFFSELSYVEVAARMNQPLDAVTARMRSALHKLRVALGRGGKAAPASPSPEKPCDHAELVCAHALRALSAADAPALEAHLSSCGPCRGELEALRPVLDAFVVWPTAVLRPSASLQPRLAQRLADKTGGRPVPPARRRWSEPAWEEVAPGVTCKLLAADTERHRVSMLVRLAAGGEYPAHTHAGVEEMHLLEGELCIDERRLHPGEYHRAEAGSGDKRVWTKTGCACVLVTSTRDRLV